MAKSYEEFMENATHARAREKEKEVLGRNNMCQIWVGGSENDRYEYPYRLVPAGRAGDRMRRASTQLMIDSDINNPDMTNKKIIEKAIECDAQYVIPKDYMEGQDHERVRNAEDAIEATHESIKEFLEMYETTECNATIVIPLQPPPDEHYNRYPDFYSQFSHFAVGGMKNAEPEKQVEAAKRAREAVGPYKELHGLGMGGTETMMEALWEHEGLLDSMDASTFERLPGFGKIAGANWKQIGDDDPHDKAAKDCDCNAFKMPEGNGDLVENEISTMNAKVVEFLLYMANYQLTSLSKYAEQSQPATELPDDSQMTLQDSWKTMDSETESVSGNEESAVKTSSVAPETETTIQSSKSD